MTTAWVLSGGASLGAVQVGMARVLSEQGVRPDLIVGTSVGALNGAWFAGGGDHVALADMWRGLQRRDLFPTNLLTGLRGFLGRSDHLVSNTALRSLLERTVRFERLEDASIPFAVVATDSRTGQEVVVRNGPTVEALLASAAIPGVYPPVEFEGRTLIDGGVANNTPISTAIVLGATEVWVLPTGHPCALPAAPTTAFSMAMQAVAFMVQRRLVLELQTRRYPVPVHVLPPPCPVTASPVDFSQTAELIDRAAEGTSAWFAGGRPDVLAVLAPHDHQAPG